MNHALSEEERIEISMILRYGYMKRSQQDTTCNILGDLFFKTNSIPSSTIGNVVTEDKLLDVCVVWENKSHLVNGQMTRKFHTSQRSIIRIIRR